MAKTAKPKPTPKSTTNKQAANKAKSPKSPAQEKTEIKQNLKKMIEAEAYRLELSRYLNREDVRMALGVGNFEDYTDQVETQFVNAVPTQPKSEATELSRPKLRKVSKRKRRKNKPLDMEK